MSIQVEMENRDLEEVRKALAQSEVIGAEQRASGVEASSVEEDMFSAAIPVPGEGEQAWRWWGDVPPPMVDAIPRQEILAGQIELAALPLFGAALFGTTERVAPRGRADSGKFSGKTPRPR